MSRFIAAWILVGSATCGTPARADIYAYVEQGASVVLTNIEARDKRAVWTIQTDAPTSSIIKPRLLGAPFRYELEVAAAAHDYGVDVDLIHAVIATESKYVSDAVSSKGAMGLMQLMPALARQYGVTNAMDATQNIRGGVQHLRHLLGVFDENTSIALAAYNAGEEAVRKYGRRIPPYPETINYVRSVERKYRERKQSHAVFPPQQ